MPLPATIKKWAQNVAEKYRLPRKVSPYEFWRLGEECLMFEALDADSRDIEKDAKRGPNHAKRGPSNLQTKAIIQLELGSGARPGSNSASDKSPSATASCFRQTKSRSASHPAAIMTLR